MVRMMRPSVGPDRRPQPRRVDRSSPAVGAGLDTDDELSLILLAPFLLGALVAGLPVLAARATEWLVTHQVLVAAASSPIWALPGADGAGLDTRRVTALGAVLVILVALGVSGLRHQRARRREYRLRNGDRR